MQPVIYQLALLTAYYKYPLIVILTLIQSPIISILAGFMYKLKFVSLVPAILAVMCGDLIGDMIWYYLGYHFGPVFVKKFGRFFSITQKNIETIEKFSTGRETMILTISKLTTGFGFAPVVLFTAGMIKVSFQKYMAINVFGQIFWTSALFAVGYLFGNLYDSINNDIWRISVAAALIILIALAFGFGKFIWHRYIEKKLQ